MIIDDQSAAAAPPRQPIRHRLTVRGIVQGVGFRPFVFGLAHRHGLGGLVGNDSNGVFIEVEGDEDAVARFAEEMVSEAPPLAHIHEVTSTALPVQGAGSFVIVESQHRSDARTFISPDLSICEDCLRELFDPLDRRFTYPFINCTNCGPRFTITRDVPYDRANTTMAVFSMCAACRAEYTDPRDRRYHAQPIACADCGPHVWFECVPEPESVARRARALEAARRSLCEGAIVAIKGLGGFHLACDATNDAAVQKLRRRKGRGDKPFAIMVRDLDAARRVAMVCDDEAARLCSRERPIVLLDAVLESGLSAYVAPGNTTVGVMLPYTPLHYLLVGETPLVMTSGNLSSEPIVTQNQEARVQLSSLADAFLFHDRDIHVPCDDSVVRVFQGADLPVRRSRGYAPFPVHLPVSVPPLLAAGGELKSTICIAVDDQAIMSQHIGDMENLETLAAFTRVADHVQTLFRVQPQRLICDMHPGYMSTHWAAQLAATRDIPLLQVQHHHAHIAAVMAENGRDGSEPVLGFAFDGTGYGPDGAIWGGETLVADYRRFQRAAHLKYVPLPGGDAAIRHPYRCALAHLWAAQLPWEAEMAPVATCRPREQQVIRRQLETGLLSVPTSSMGRLFDAVAALIGIRQSVDYEAQAALEMEAVAADEPVEGYRFVLEGPRQAGECISIDPARLLAEIVADRRRSVPAPVIAARFHQAVADLVLRLSVRLRRETGLGTIALSGGVFANTRLLSLTVSACEEEGFEVLRHRLVPPNDGGLALGQAIIGGSLAAET